LSALGTRVVVASLRPLGGVAGAAVDAAVTVERYATARVLDSPELERILVSAVESPRVQAAVKRALVSDGVRDIVTAVFESGLFDLIAERLLASEALWHLVDEIAASPAVTAAITQQGLGFADQVGEEVRTRSRSADDWLERAAWRLVHRRTPTPRRGTEGLRPGPP